MNLIHPQTVDELWTKIPGSSWYRAGMRTLAGDPAPSGDHDLDAIEAVAIQHVSESSPDRWVSVNMAASFDGAIEVDGRSAPLSSSADRIFFHGLRSLADVIVVGAGTARAEDYGRPTAASGSAAAERKTRGQADAPRLCIVSGSLAFDRVPRALEDPPGEGAAPVWVATPRSAADAATVVPHAEIIEMAGPPLDPSQLLDSLAQRGVRRILVEGGPTLLGSFLAGDLIDEWNVTVSPLAVAGPSGRMARGPQPTARGFVLDRAVEHDSNLFLRYLRSR